MMKEITVPELEDNRYLMGKTLVPVNSWIDTPPYSIIQEVFVQDFNGNVSFAWVGCRLEQNEDEFKIAGLQGDIGNKPLKYYMIIPMPFEDPAGWNFAESEKQPIKNRQYLVAYEEKCGNHISYHFRLSHYIPGKYSDWSGFNYQNSNDVIAWREIPRSKKG